MVSDSRSNINIENALNDSRSTDYGGNYQLPGSKSSDQSSGGGHKSKNAAYVHPMSYKKLCFLHEEETTIAAFLEVIHPESGFIECLSRKTNGYETIVAVCNVICKVSELPFGESIRCLFEDIVAEENFWAQAEKYSKESTATAKKFKVKPKKGQALPKIDVEIWQRVTQLCQCINDQKIRLKKTFLKNIVQLATANENTELKLDAYIQQLIRIQEQQLKLKEQVNYRDIFPTLDELKCTDDEPLNPNIVKGKYRDVSHYLGVHLALLREDFLAPLREGVQKIMSDFGADEEARSNLNVKVYPGVRIVVTEKDLPFRPGMKVECIVADLEARERDENVALGKYAQAKFSKRLMYGSLLCLTTSNQFDDLVVAIVSNRDSDLLEQGYVSAGMLHLGNVMI